MILGKRYDLTKNLEVLKDLKLTDEEKKAIEKIKTSSIYRAYAKKKIKEFLGK